MGLRNASDMKVEAMLAPFVYSKILERRESANANGFLEFLLFGLIGQPVDYDVGSINQRLPLFL